MIGALLLLVVAADSPIPQAAFTARVYLPGNARSYHDVYLWRGPERGAERLVQTKTNIHSVRWLDRNRLAWIEYEDDFNIGGKWRSIEFDLSDMTSEVTEDGTIEPGSHSRPSYLPDKINPPKGRSYGVLSEPDYVGVEPTGVAVPTDSIPSHVSVFEFQGKRLKAGMSYHGLARFVPGRAEGEFFLYDGTFASSAGSWAGVWRLDFDAMEVEQIIEGPTTIEFHPSYPCWSGVTSRKWLIDFDGKRLWHEKGFVGNWQTGEVWEVMEKPSIVSSIALRPRRS